MQILLCNCKVCVCTKRSPLSGEGIFLSLGEELLLDHKDIQELSKAHCSNCIQRLNKEICSFVSL